MNFAQFTTGGMTFTAGRAGPGVRGLHQAGQVPEQASRRVRASAAPSSCRWSSRIDLSLTQDVFQSIGGHRHSGQFRLDITNFGNLLNHNWGVGQRIIQNRILTNPAVDCQGR